MVGTTHTIRFARETYLDQATGWLVNRYSALCSCGWTHTTDNLSGCQARAATHDLDVIEPVGCRHGISPAHLCAECNP